MQNNIFDKEKQKLILLSQTSSMKRKILLNSLKDISIYSVPMKAVDIHFCKLWLAPVTRDNQEH